MGRHLLKELCGGAGVRVAATVLGEVPSRESFPAELAEVEWYAMDVCSTESIADVVRRVRPEGVFHLAGQASVGASFEAPLATWEVNATGTVRLFCVLAREAPEVRRVVLASSAEVYGAVPEEEQPIGESAAYQPSTPYGASKAAAEVAALQLGGMYGIEVVVARAFNHVGPGQEERFVLPSMARQLVRIRQGGAEPILRVGNLGVRRDFLDVRDVTRAYRTLMEQAPAGGVFNICSGVGQPLEKVIERLVELSGTGARIEVDPARVRPADIPVLVGDPTRLRALGWQPRIDLDRTLRDLLEDAELRA